MDALKQHNLVKGLNTWDKVHTKGETNVLYEGELKLVEGFDALVRSEYDVPLIQLLENTEENQEVIQERIRLIEEIPLATFVSHSNADVSNHVRNLHHFFDLAKRNFENNPANKGEKYVLTRKMVVDKIADRDLEWLFFIDRNVHSVDSADFVDIIVESVNKNTGKSFQHRAWEMGAFYIPSELNATSLKLITTKLSLLASHAQVNRENVDQHKGIKNNLFLLVGNDVTKLQRPYEWLRAVQKRFSKNVEKYTPYTSLSKPQKVVVDQLIRALGLVQNVEKTTLMVSPTSIFVLKGEGRSWQFEVGLGPDGVCLHPVGTNKVAFLPQNVWEIFSKSSERVLEPLVFSVNSYFYRKGKLFSMEVLPDGTAKVLEDNINSPQKDLTGLKKLPDGYDQIDNRMVPNPLFEGIRKEKQRARALAGRGQGVSPKASAKGYLPGSLGSPLDKKVGLQVNSMLRGSGLLTTSFLMKKF